MARNFKELEAKMTPESIARSKEKAARLLVRSSISDCCNAPVRVGGDNDGFGAATCYYVCTACGDACDTKPKG